MPSAEQIPSQVRDVNASLLLHPVPTSTAGQAQNAWHMGNSLMAAPRELNQVSPRTPLGESSQRKRMNGMEASVIKEVEEHEEQDDALNDNGAN